MYVVAEPCIKCKYTDCVEVCPVDCFYEGVNFLVIDPETCVDCAACEPVCPAEAIYADSDLPPKWAAYVEINARYAKLWPNISDKKEPLPDADRWKSVAAKAEQLDSTPAAI